MADGGVLHSVFRGASIARTQRDVWGGLGGDKEFPAIFYVKKWRHDVMGGSSIISLKHPVSFQKLSPSSLFLFDYPSFSWLIS